MVIASAVLSLIAARGPAVPGIPTRDSTAFAGGHVRQPGSPAAWRHHQHTGFGFGDSGITDFQRPCDRPQGPVFRASTSALTAAMRARMTGVSWYPGCPVPLTSGSATGALTTPLTEAS